MARSKHRFHSVGRTATTDERPGIFGLETEYAVLYLADDDDDSRRPPFSLIQEILFSSLLSERKAATSAGLKDGYFLQNGGLVHLEICVRHQGDTPIFEASTPECRSPWDLVVYSRSFDKLLDEVGRKSRQALLTYGYRGCIAFGKNNLDSRGTGYGCHENYLVHLPCRRLETALFLAFLPVVLVCLLPFFALFLLGLLGYSFGLVLAKAIPPLRAAFKRTYDWLSGFIWLTQTARATYYMVSNSLLLPAIWIYARILRHLAFRAFTRNLTSFLVSRQILTGSGTLDHRRRVFELSQRPALTATLGTIIMFGKRKTIFDLKGFLYDPLAFFRPAKKLTVTLGDSNLSDIPTLLKVGTTALVIEMIESGECFEPLRLRNPVKAFRQISLGGPWKEVRLRRGTTKRAIDLQRAYLLRARQFFAGRRIGRMRHDEILDLWEEALNRLEEGPQTLADSLDWVAKKSLLDAAILSRSNWKNFFAWGHVFHHAGLQATAEAASLEQLLSRLPFWKRRSVRRAAARFRLREEEFQLERELYFQARKIDLRYHEINTGNGYQRTLERDGLIRRLSSEDQVERATREPPSDTRARIRGYYIKLSPTPDSLHVNWNEIEFQSPQRQILLPDPFFCRLPGDE